MRVTAYFDKGIDMSAKAERWAFERSDRWFVRTTMRCDHIHHEKRKAILLVEGEQVVQKLITCKICKKYAGTHNVPLINEDLDFEEGGEK